MTNRIATISALCQAWVDEIVQPDGGVVIAIGAADNPLTRNGILPHTMSHGELRAACLGLTNVLSIPNYQSIGPDDLLFWGWCAQIFDTVYGYFQPRSAADIELRNLFGAMAHASLADPQIVSAYEQDASVLNALPTPTRQALAFVRDHFVVSAYLCFPLLEGVLRKTLSQFVDRDGTVVQDFAVSGCSYGLTGRNRCNNVAHMLFQLDADQREKKTELAVDLAAATSHLQRADPNRHPYKMIADWRNSSLHGNVSLATIGARVLNLVCLIALHNLTDLEQRPLDYDTVASSARQAALAHPRDVRWSYYPREVMG